MTSLMASRGRLSWTASLIRYWYARLPRKLAPLVPRVARAVGDGAWAVVWVRMAAWAPVLVFILALFVPRTWPGTLDVYTESPFFLAFAATLSILSGTLGVALLAGNGLREALSHDVASGLNAVIHEGGSRLIVWLLLAVLVVVLPQLSHLVTEAGVVRMRFLRNRDLRAIVRSLLLAVIYPCFVMVWCQAMTVLVRPVFTWTGGSPSFGAVREMQIWWAWLVSAAAAAAVLRGVLEGMVAPRIRCAPEVEALRRERSTFSQMPDAARRRAPEALRILLAVIGMTLLLAGTFERGTDALLAAATIGLLAMLNRGLCGWLTGRWATRVRKVPGALRIATALGFGYVLAVQTLELTWVTDSVQSVMIGTLLTLTLFFLLFPATRSLEPASQESL